MKTKVVAVYVVMIAIVVLAAYGFSVLIGENESSSSAQDERSTNTTELPHEAYIADLAKEGITITNLSLATQMASRNCDTLAAADQQGNSYSVGFGTAVAELYNTSADSLTLEQSRANVRINLKHFVPNTLDDCLI